MKATWSKSGYFCCMDPLNSALADDMTWQSPDVTEMF